MRINDGAFAEKHPHFLWKTSRHSGKSAGTFVKRLAVFPPQAAKHVLFPPERHLKRRISKQQKETEPSAARTKKRKIPHSKTKTKGKRLALRQRTPSGTLFLRIFQAAPGKGRNKRFSPLRIVILSNRYGPEITLPLLPAARAPFRRIAKEVPRKRP